MIEITTSALQDVLCEGCGEDGERPYGSSCSECMAHAAKEVTSRLRELDALREIIQNGYNAISGDE